MNIDEVRIPLAHCEVRPSGVGYSVEHVDIHLDLYLQTGRGRVDPACDTGALQATGVCMTMIMTGEQVFNKVSEVIESERRGMQLFAVIRGARTCFGDAA